LATARFTIPNFSLTSYWYYSNGKKDEGYWGISRITTARTTKTVDISSITPGSRIKSAKLSISTTTNGSTYATCNDVKVDTYGTKTNIDVSRWFTNFGSSLSIEFEYTANGRSSGTSNPEFNKNNFQNIVIEVEYELPNSTGTFDVTSVEAGPNASIGLTISPANADYTHTAVWTFGEQTVEQNLAAGVTTTSLAIPTSFCSEIPNATSGTGTVVLTTYNNGTQLGDPQTYTFTVTVPETVVPTSGSLESTPVTPSQSLANLYVQRYSHAALTLAGVQGAYGSTITNVVFSGWGGSVTVTEPESGSASGSVYTANSATLNTSGSVRLRAVVTDSRGRTCTKETTITVSAYSAPTIESISANRCTQDGTRSDTGTYALLTVNYNITSLGGNNTATTATAYKTTDATNYTNANTTFGDNVATMLTVGGVFAADKSYNIRATVSDSLTNTATAQITLQTAEYVLHFLNGGKSIGIGRAALNTPQTVAINPTWSLILGKHGDAAQTIDVAEAISGLETTVNDMKTDEISADNIKDGKLSVDHGGTGGTTVAEAKAALGFTQKEVVTASNNSAVAENSTMFSVKIDLAEGDMWQGIAVLGVNSSTNTDFLVFFDDDYTVANYRSYLRYGTSSVVENGCMMAFTGIATRKCVVRFTVSMLGGMAIVTGQCIRGDGKIGDFVIAKAVSGVTNLVIRPSAAVTAGHGSSIMLTKVY